MHFFEQWCEAVEASCLLECLDELEDGCVGIGLEEVGELGDFEACICFFPLSAIR